MDARGTRGTEAAAERAAAPPARRARVLAWALQASALGASVVFGLVGGIPTEVGVLLVLLVAAAVCVNRQALFPFEISVTAEASVVLCTVVLFRADAPLLAPMVVGLAAGWLDSFQWASRAWTPMAFNSGTRAIEALGAALAFGAVTEAAGHDTASLVAAGAVAAFAFAAADLVLITALVVVRDGQPVGVAARAVWRVDAVSFPLALLGASIGLLGDATTAWIGALAVLPAAALPDALLAARDHVPWRRIGAYGAGVAAGVAVVAVVGVAVGFPPAPVTVALVALGVVAGGELVADRRVPVAPALGAAVLLAVSAVRPADAVVAGAIVAVVAATLSWSLAPLAPLARRRVRVTASAWAVVAAIGSGLLVAATGSSALAGAAFLATAVVAAPGRRAAAAVGWSLPFVALGGTVGALRPWADGLATLMVGGAVLVVGALVVAWAGAPPWPSRVASRWARGRLRLSHRVTWWVLVALGVVAAGIGLSAGPPTDAVAVVCLASVVALAAAVAVVRVRLWRFRRPRRWVEAATLDVAALAAWAAAAWAADRPGAAWVVAVSAAVVTFVVGATTIDVADRAETSGRHRRDRAHLEEVP